MNKKLLVSLLLIAPMGIYAEVSSMPPRVSGIEIVPMAKQNLPKEMKADILAKKAEENQKGYHFTSKNNAGFLLNIKKHAAEEKAIKINKYGVYDTHIKSNYSDIKLSFPFKGIKSINKGDVLGYVAVGSYVKEKNNQGWNGIRVFFESPMGNCSYMHMGIRGAQLSEETTEYLVNKKPSNKAIEGNTNTGFVYSLNWYTNNNMNTLECANKDFQKNILDEMILLANKIDKDIDL